jgi:hypothetical protein
MFHAPKKSAAPAGPVKQLDLDICLALTGKPVVLPDPNAPVDENALSLAPEIEPQQWLMIPTSKESMRQWVKTVQSRVVQVGDAVKARMAEASAQMGARMVDSHLIMQRRKAG